MEFLNKALKDQGGSSAIMKMLPGLIQSQGGVQGLISKFNQAGLGDKVQSWVGKGPNQPLSGNEVRQALGDDEVDRLAQEGGVSREEASDQIASALPGTVDQLTPEGNVPSADDLKGMMKSFGL